MTTKTATTKSPGRSRPQPGWIRILIPAILVLVWLGVTAVGGQTFGKVAEVTTNDQTTFLPADAESTRALEVGEGFSDDDSIPATLIGEPASGEVDDQALGELETLVGQINELDGVDRSLPPQISEDGEAFQVLVLMEEAAVEDGAVAELRDLVDAELSAQEWTTHVTGPAALSDDFANAFAGIDGLLLLVAVITVFVILVVVYRSVLLPFLVLLSSIAALSSAITVIFQLAKMEWITLNGQAQGILSILVIGAATDYSLLLVARYREELLARENRFDALWIAWRRSTPAILASGGTVAAALLCLLFSDLNSNRALGPVASTGIVFAMLATLTFLPAMLALFGRPVFWPKVPHAPRPAVEQAQAANPDLQTRRTKHTSRRRTLWAVVAEKVRARPRVIWLVVTGLLLVASVGVLDLKAEGVPQSEQVLGQTDAKDGQAMLQEHFDAGTGAPANVFVPAEELAESLEIVEASDGVGEVYAVAETGAPAQGPQDANEVDGYNQLSVTLTDSGDSLEAERTISELRGELGALEGDALVGGTTATQLDTNETAQRDLITIIPIVLLVILAFLIVLLRSVTAPVILLLTTVLSYTAALGISALVFNYILGFPGADPTVPLFGFVFLTALGVDYNIFLATRAREETVRRGPKEGLLYSLVITGGVITSAGIVLAATFAALGVLPLMFMVQLAFLVALGVLIDTFIVRTLQVPAIGVDLGHRFWWPSKIGRGDHWAKQDATTPGPEDSDPDQSADLSEDSSVPAAQPR
ncbi:MMPL family transporter [Nesterenkonia sp. E16_7]|uniref:MMPL family transporter n=1 Tax=unclassified Nesterenkonia TaxID=2629769 RepID=UPI001A912282|nr:MMPL family transporter [Nesterenkonia sp. E16_10]MBO0599212.1 MMPL family transporter [Nesterenkonia sp. E16_7]